MEPTLTSTINGIDLAMLCVGVVVGFAIGYLYGWLHFGDAEEGDE